MSNIKTPDMPASFSYANLTSYPRRRPSIHPDHTSNTVTPPMYQHEHEHEHQRSDPHPRPKKMALSQKALFRTAAPPLLFVILIAGLLVELRARLASPLPEAPQGLAVSVQGDTIMQRALIWAERRWPGSWAVPVLCLVALGALRATIWACAAMLDFFDGRVDVSGVAGVRIGRWEDGGSVSGSELLAGMFT